MYGLKVVVGLELTLGVWGYGWLSGVQDQRANGAEFTQEVAVVERIEDLLNADDDPLVNFQRQLDELQAQTNSLKAELEESKKKSDKSISFNSPFSVKIGGQVRFDGVLASQDEESKEYVGNVRNSFGVHDVRLTFEGTGHENLQYRLFVVVNKNISFQDAYIRAKNTRIGDITFGNFFVESGMESIDTNADRPFANIDENASLFGLRRRFGVATRIFGAEKKSRAHFGVYLPKNLATNPHRVSYDGPGLVLNTRLTSTPILVEDEEGFTREILHFGGSYYWVHTGSNTNLDLSVAGLRWQSDSPSFVEATIPMNGRAYSMTNVETAYQREGFGTNAEGYLMSIEDNGQVFGTTVSARWILTPGCTRTYKKEDARFGSVKMSDDALFLNYKDRTVGQNLGAWEALAKWEWTEVNNVKSIANATYGNVHRSVLGCNWFWNEQTSWTFAWEHAFVDATKTVNLEKGNYGVDTLVLQGYFKF